MRRVAFPVITAVAVICCIPVAQAASINVTYTIDTDVNRTPISPYIYGGNGQAGSHYTIQRSGGNRLTAYNWENNYSNAGADWWWNNDTYLPWNAGIPWEDWLIPGIVATDFRNSCISNNQDSIVTLQMAGYVSADDYGFVDCNTEAAPSSRFEEVVFAKGAPFCSPPGNPVTTDGYVYMDEFVNFLVSTYGYANQTNGVKFYDLDNEPALWYQDGGSHATHWEVHPYRPTCVELRDKSIALSTAVKNVDPYAQILGPVLYGFAAYLSFQSAPDWGTEGSGYSWFITYYLDKMKQAGISAGKRLLDVLDLHWYPEARDGDGTRIVFESWPPYSRTNIEARMQAPRTLWDPDYVWPNGETSWINDSWSVQYLPLIPRLKNDINQYYSGTKLAFTEYDYGGKDHYSGGIAFADVLGIFGKYGVYIANYWDASGSSLPSTYSTAAFKIYRNYDGAGSTFGDTEVDSTMTDKENSSIYASVSDDQACELHLIVINKNIDNTISGTFNINSRRNYTSGRIWKFDNNSSNITETTSISTITDNSFTYTIPKTTVFHIVLQADPPAWDLSGGDCHVNLEDLDVFVDDWLDETDFLNFEDFASFGLEWGL